MLGTGPRTTVALSGVVGAGKSTTAKAVVRQLRSAGYPAESVRFQDFTRLRGRRAADAMSSATNPETVELDRAEKRWSGYERRGLSFRIAAGYALRTLVFRARLRRWSHDTILVFDRYFYDSLVHFDLSRAGLSLRLLMGVIPTPTVAALLLVRERTILERRPRYSPEYVRQATQGYEELPERIPGLLVLRTDDLAPTADDVADRIVAGVLTRVGCRNGR